MRKSVRIFLLAVLLMIGYVMWDNGRIVIVEQEIVVDGLDDKLNGFRILQMTDLHEREFGKNQRRLLKKINSLSYDALVFTGDMVNDGSTNYKPFFNLIEGIDNKEHLLYVPGNTDLDTYELSPHFKKSDYIVELEKRGVRLLESMYTIEKDSKFIHFVDFELAIIKDPKQIGNINGTFMSMYTHHKNYQIYKQKLWEEMVQSEGFNSDDPIIALNHFPVPDIRVDFIESDPNTVWHEFDLIIAGHYHGGQFRIPFYGALFIPDPWYEPNSLFPPQDRVKGLWEYKGKKQYVSTGLGSSDAIPLFKFRLFNPPEINLLILNSE